MKYLLLMLLPLLSIAETKVLTLSESNTISFNQPFTARYVAQKQVEILALDAELDEGESITLVLNTPGGSIDAGNRLIDMIAGLGRPVNTLTLFSASMGYHTVQNLGTRYITPSGTLMSHRASIRGLGGTIDGEAETALAWIKAIVDIMDFKAATRVGLDLLTYKELIRDELWITGQEAVTKNHADAVAVAKCDESLSGTYTDLFYTMFGPVSVTFSKCPLVTAPLKVESANRKAKSKVTQLYENMAKSVGFSL
jgi:ATP-dependent Clp protease protease subunit